MYNYLFIKKDMDNFAKVNVIYSKYFNSGDKPARSTVAVKTLPKNKLYNKLYNFNIYKCFI